MSENLVMRFLDALDEYIEAKSNHDHARDRSEVNWGYFGHREIDRLEKAREAVGNALREFVIENASRRSGENQ